MNRITYTWAGFNDANPFGSTYAYEYDSVKRATKAAQNAIASKKYEKCEVRKEESYTTKDVESGSMLYGYTVSPIMTII